MNPVPVVMGALTIGLVLTFAQAHAEDLVALQKQRVALEQDIIKMNQGPAELFCKTNRDCEAYALGDKDCGGPVRYIVASKLHPRRGEVEKRARELKELDKRISKVGQMMSTCDVVAAFDVTCRKGTCQKALTSSSPAKK